MDWRHESACRDEDPELFFPVGNTGPAITQIEEAKKVCNRCVVKDACLAWALESGQDAGVWGGLSEDERRALKRRALATGSTADDDEIKLRLWGCFRGLTSHAGLDSHLYATRFNTFATLAKYSRAHSGGVNLSRA